MEHAENVSMATVAKAAAAVVVIALGCWTIAAAAQSSDPLPSWNDASARQAVVEFVEAVTAEGGADFVPPADRIATFDQDGTLWVEQPLYGQPCSRSNGSARWPPSTRSGRPRSRSRRCSRVTTRRWRGSARGDWMKIIAAIHAGMTNDAFQEIVEAWITEAKHPRFDRLSTELVYQPMLEVMAYLRANGFGPTS
jgi:hypothetical protein